MHSFHYISQHFNLFASPPLWFYVVGVYGCACILQFKMKFYLNAWDSTIVCLLHYAASEKKCIYILNLGYWFEITLHSAQSVRKLLGKKTPKSWYFRTHKNIESWQWQIFTATIYIFVNNRIYIQCGSNKIKTNFNNSGNNNNNKNAWEEKKNVSQKQSFESKI